MSDTPASELARIYSRVPNANCTGQCINSCYNVPAFRQEPIVALTDPKHIQPVGEHLVILTERDGKCPHLIDGRCSQYENRPLVCRLYGSSVPLPCPFDCKPDRLLSKAEADSIKKTAGNLTRSHGR